MSVYNKKYMHTWFFLLLVKVSFVTVKNWKLSTGPPAGEWTKSTQNSTRWQNKTTPDTWNESENYGVGQPDKDAHKLGPHTMALKCKPAPNATWTYNVIHTNSERKLTTKKDFQGLRSPNSQQDDWRVFDLQKWEVGIWHRCWCQEKVGIWHGHRHHTTPHVSPRGQLQPQNPCPRPAQSAFSALPSSRHSPGSHGHPGSEPVDASCPSSFLK